MIIRKEFYFIRHGQTDYNLSNVKIDHEDVSLNATGVQQALAVEPMIASLPIKSVCYSPFKRAKETKELVSSRLEAAHHEISELGECSKKVWDDMLQCGIDAYQSSCIHVNRFMEQTLAGINQALSIEGPALVVAHGGIHWALCCLMRLANHEWMIDNCLPVHFFPGPERQWLARKL